MGGYVPAGQLAMAALGIGDRDAAVTWLSEGARLERDPNILLINEYPFLRHLHGHDGFLQLLRDMHLTIVP